MTFLSHLDRFFLWDVAAEEQEADELVVADVREPFQEGAEVEPDHILQRIMIFLILSFSHFTRSMIYKGHLGFQLIMSQKILVQAALYQNFLKFD